MNIGEHSKQQYSKKHSIQKSTDKKFCKRDVLSFVWLDSFDRKGLGS